VLGYSGEVHLASLSISIQSIFLLPAIIKYNSLSQPIEKLGDELYSLSSDSVVVINKQGIILNINKAARKLFNLSGPIKNKNIEKLFNTEDNILTNNKSFDAKTKTGYHVTIVQNEIIRGEFAYSYWIWRI
jgi:transcriptional regulator with PAS, ATPase and Fis domain